MNVDPTRARLGPAPHYESYYLKARHPGEPLAFWIRHTVLVRPGSAPAAAVWFTLFEPAGVRAVQVARLQPSTPRDGWFAAGESRIGDGRAGGTAAGADCSASWDVRFTMDAEPLFHLPATWMYKARLPKTKSISVQPFTRLDGVLRVDGREWVLDGWPGMVGHNWGTEHAARWIWLHGAGFDGAGDDTWIDVVLGRVEIAGRTTPWIAGGAVSIDGTRRRIGGLRRRPEVSEHYAGAELRLPAEGLRADVNVSSGQVAGWRYADPTGGEHHVFNSSVADMTLALPGRTLRSEAGAVYELGVRETDHGLALQPYPAEA
ncbi:MAG TPA: hypothetical protein VGB83_04120 [Actinomycetota bacterium]